MTGLKPDFELDKKRFLIVKEIESMILNATLIVLEKINENLRDEYISIQESKEDSIPF